MEQKTMTVGVIGSGAISDIYLTNMINVFDNLQVKAVASAHIENAMKKAEKYGISACTVGQMLADPQIEMVVILTPVETHYELIKSALNEGKHVYTEKTIADSVEHAQELCELADRKGLYLGSAPDTFMGAAWQTARKAIDEGLIGDIHSFVISATRNNDILLSLFSFLRAPGCGICYDYMVYYVTALVALLGKVKNVSGMVSAPYPNHVNIIPNSPLFGQVMETPNESQVSAILQLENGITGTLHADADCILQDEALFRIYGTKGVLYLTDPNQFGGTVKCMPLGTDWMNPPEAFVVEGPTEYRENSRGIGPSEMAAAIMEGRPNLATKEQATHVLKVLNAILMSKGNLVEIR